MVGHHYQKSFLKKKPIYTRLLQVPKGQHRAKHGTQKEKSFDTTIKFIKMYEGITFLVTDMDSNW